MITGETPDISEYLDFGFYNWVTFRTNAGLGEPSLGRWLGVSHKIGQLMSYWILPESAKPISCVTVQRLTDAERATDEYKQLMSSYTTNVTKAISIADETASHPDDVPDWNRLSIDESDPQFRKDFQDIINDPGIPDVDTPQESFVNDEYLNTEFGLPRGPNETPEFATVKRRAVDVDGIPIGAPSTNPMTDTRMYDIQYLDGTIETVSANVIAECLLSQVDSEGHRQLMLDEIIDHRSNSNAVGTNDEFYFTETGIK